MENTAIRPLSEINTDNLSVYLYIRLVRFESKVILFLILILMA